MSKFTGSSLDIPFSSIDVAWLKRYEEWLIKRKCKGTTLSVLFRTLRSAFNRAVEAKIVNKKYGYTKKREKELENIDEKKGGSL